MSADRSGPAATVDVIIQVGEAIVLVKRRFPPPGWALPGGFVDVGEPLWRAALREAREETQLEVELSEQFFTYSDPSRDARRHTLSTVFIGRASGLPVAADDAAEAALFTEDTLPPLAFDHARILKDYYTYLGTGRRPPPTR